MNEFSLFVLIHDHYKMRKQAKTGADSVKWQLFKYMIRTWFRSFAS